MWFDMTKDEFNHLFELTMEQAAQNADQKLGSIVPRHFEILLFGAGHSRDRMSPQLAVDILYLGEDKFYRVIDVAVIEVRRHTTTLYVRASGHQPSSFEETWNTPPGSGPFKQLIAKEIKVLDE